MGKKNVSWKVFPKCNTADKQNSNMLNHPGKECQEGHKKKQGGRINAAPCITPKNQMKTIYS